MHDTITLGAFLVIGFIAFAAFEPRAYISTQSSGPFGRIYEQLPHVHEAFKPAIHTH